MSEANLESGALILVVDDDQFMQDLFRDNLEKAGFRTARAGNGVQALAEFDRLQPDLVLLDLIMPMRDGFETCRELRQRPSGRHTPVLAVTGSDNNELVHRAFDAGATDFIVKSINPALLVYRVRCLLRNGRVLNKLQQSEDRLARVQQIARLGDWEWSPASGAFWMSPEMQRILGLAPVVEGATTLESFLEAVLPQDRDLVRASLKRALSGGACDFECCVKRDGAERTVWAYGRLEPGPGSQGGRMVGTLQDVTEVRRAEQRSRMLKEAVDSLQIGVTFSDADGRIVYLNPAEARMHGYDVEELIGRPARDFAGHQPKKKVPPPEKLKEGTVWRRESVNRRKNGEMFPVLLTSIPVRDPERRYLGIVTTCEDISEAKRAEARINRLAYYDPLTGLPNRGMFLDRLHQSLALATRDGERVGLMFLDLDKFKDINDTLGHPAGDKLLCEVAQRLTGCLRDADILARLGGDEFVVLITSVHQQENVSAAAQRMLDVFGAPFEVEGRSLYTSASIGVAIYPDDSHDASSLFRCADTAMYHAKNEGRGQFRFFSEEMNQKIMRRVALENSLRRGLEKEEFFLHYQPQWDLKTNRMVGVEVLLRWQSEDFGLMPPSEFISLTEDSGLIFSLGEWILKNACRQARAWADEGQRIKMAVNISGKQLKQPEFLEMLTGIFAETGVDPRMLELEFTESVIMENAERTIEILAALKAMGVQLSIDDFGTGYSSLNYLKHFPVDRIKIDRTFVAEVNRSNDDAAIVEAIITMAQSLDLKVLAEGVENSDQLHFLTELGCDEVQGFYLAKPMPAESLSGNLGGTHGRPAEKTGVTEWYDGREGAP